MDRQTPYSFSRILSLPYEETIAQWGCLFLFLLFCFFPPALAEAGLKEQVFATVLPNGLKVILLENHKAPLITFQVWYRVGSRNEEWGRTGLSHMLEHMMFKGTQKVGPEEFSRIIQENGGNDLNPVAFKFPGRHSNLFHPRLADRHLNRIP